MKYVFAILLSFVLLDSFADCEPKRSVRIEFINRDYVFIGIPISKEEFVFLDSLEFKKFNCENCEMQRALCTRTLFKYQFVVSEVFKGNLPGDTITLYSDIPGGMNGYNFEFGKNYIVYAYTVNPCFFSGNLIFKQEVIKTSGCTRTCLYNTNEYNEIKFFINYRKS